MDDMSKPFQPKSIWLQFKEKTFYFQPCGFNKWTWCLFLIPVLFGCGDKLFFLTQNVSKTMSPVYLLATVMWLAFFTILYMKQSQQGPPSLLGPLSFGEATVHTNLFAFTSLCISYMLTGHHVSPFAWPSWCIYIAVPLAHHLSPSLSLVWASSLLPVCCNPPIPSPSPRLPALLSLGAAWGDGCGFGQWCLQSVYRRTASALSRLPQSHRLRCCTLGQTCLSSDWTTRRLEAADIRTRSSLSAAWGKMQYSHEALFHVYKGW